MTQKHKTVTTRKVAQEAVNLEAQVNTAYAKDDNVALAYVPENLLGTYRRHGYKNVDVDEVELLDADSRQPVEKDIGVFHIDDLGDGVAGVQGADGTVYLMRGDKKEINARREQKKALRSPVVQDNHDTQAVIKASRRYNSQEYTGLMNEQASEVIEAGR